MKPERSALAPINNGRPGGQFLLVQTASAGLAPTLPTSRAHRTKAGKERSVPAGPPGNPA